MVGHPVQLSAPRLAPFGGRKGSPPAVIERTDADFIPALLADLRQGETRAGLAPQLRLEVDGQRLYQPVHRAFSIVLADAWCDVLGAPRLDPAAVHSAALVVRRLRQGREQAWVRRDGRLVGWVDVPAKQETWDPDPRNRRSPVRDTPAVRRALARVRAPSDEEHTTRLFPVPPEIVQATGRTLLYGVLPTASAEAPDGPPPALDWTPEDLDEILPELLRSSAQVDLPWTGRRLRAQGSAAADDAWVTVADLEGHGTGRKLLELVQVMAQLLDLLGDSPESRALVSALDRVSLPTWDDVRLFGSDLKLSEISPHVGAGAFLQDAARVLIHGEARAQDGRWLAMPAHWPPVPREVAAAIRSAAEVVLRRQYTGLVSAPRRYDGEGDQYVARVFLRVRHHPDCPLDLVVSAPTRPFTLAPWHAPPPEGVRPAVVPLPSPTRENLAKLKPNVAFHVPADLFAALRANKAADLIEGDGSKGRAALEWICGFNIPIITICAFVVLWLFLTLLHIVFWWLPFVKVCIPLPRKR